MSSDLSPAGDRLLDPPSAYASNGQPRTRHIPRNSASGPAPRSPQAVKQLRGRDTRVRSVNLFFAPNGPGSVVAGAWRQAPGVGGALGYSVRSVDAVRVLALQSAGRSLSKNFAP